MFAFLSNGFEGFGMDGLDGGIGGIFLCALLRGVTGASEGL